MLIFNDLLFDNEKVILEDTDVKTTFPDSTGKITYIENVDGLIFAAATAGILRKDI